MKPILLINISCFIIIPIIIISSFCVNSVLMQINTISSTNNCSLEENKCLSIINNHLDCPVGEFVELDLNNCCPTCRKGLGYNETNCDTGPNTQCSPGLQCQKTTNLNTCYYDKNSCSYTQHLKGFKFLPKCEWDGTFAAKQCKGDKIFGRCFCYNEQGKRIYGSDWLINAENMTCACSRHKYRLESQNLVSTLHCSPNGNYEPLQCESGICWCADHKTGRILHGTRAVPSNLWTLLPCYNGAILGSKYLRQCDSIATAQYNLKQSLSIHGTQTIPLIHAVCDYNGNYGITKIVEKIAVACSWLDGNRIDTYQAILRDLNLMNCNCARDIKWFEQENYELSLVCSSNGNYDKVQFNNGKWFCVDSDGVAVTEFFDIDIDAGGNEFAYCNQFLYYEQF